MFNNFAVYFILTDIHQNYL